MSREYSRTQSGFSTSDDRVRLIVQEELEDFFSAIKVEIQKKIKQIDRTLIDIQANISHLASTKPDDLNHIRQKIADIEGMIEGLRKEREVEMERITETFRSKSQEKALFRKTKAAPDLDFILFGENRNQANVESSPARKKSPLGKPPLPKPKVSKQAPEIFDFSQPEQPARNTRSWGEDSSSQSEPECPPQLHQPQLEPQPQQEPEDVRAEGGVSNRVSKSLTKNKSCFMRKGFKTIPEEELEESMMNSR